MPAWLDAKALVTLGIIGAVVAGYLYWQHLETTISTQLQTIGSMTEKLKDAVQIGNDNAAALTAANARAALQIKTLKAETDARAKAVEYAMVVHGNIHNALPTNCPIPDSLRIALDGVRLPSGN